MTIIRRARLDDAAGIARVYVESWRSTYPGLIPDGFLLGMSELASIKRWRAQMETPSGVHVAVDYQHSIVGFGSCGNQSSRIEGYGGEFYTLYLRETAKGRGLGRRLMSAMAVDMISRGHPSGLVWVLRGNPARWFYERLGGQQLGEQQILLGKALLPEIAYGWRDLAELARLPINPSVE